MDGPTGGLTDRQVDGQADEPQMNKAFLGVQYSHFIHMEEDSLFPTEFL